MVDTNEQHNNVSGSQEDYSDLITINNDGLSRLDDFANNQDRRNFVAKEFVQGNFTSKAHADFYIDQLLKGNLVMPTDQKDIAKIDAMLGGKEGIQRLQEQLAQDVVADWAAEHWKTANAGVGKLWQASQISGLEDVNKFDDFGLGKTLRKYQRAANKDNFARLMREAQQKAIEVRFNGGNDDCDSYAQGLRAKRDGISKWHFIRRLKLRQAIKSIDSASRVSKRKEKRFDRLAKRLNNVIEMKKQDASMKWVSKNILKKAGLKIRLAFRRSPEKLTEKLLKSANIKQLTDFTKGLNGKYAELTDKNKMEEINHGDKKTADGYNLYIGMMNSVINKCTNQANQMENQKLLALKNLDGNIPESTTETLQSVTKNLQNRVDWLSREYSNKITKDQRIQLYMKLHGDELPKNGRIHQEIITTSAVLQQMCKAMGYNDIESLLKASNLRPQEVEDIKTKLLGSKTKDQTPQKPEIVTENDENYPTNEADENVAPNEQQAKANVGRNHINQPVEIETELAGYTKGDDAVYTNTENQDTVLFGIAQDKSRYDLIAQDKDGQEREPNETEINAMVQQIARDGNKEITIEPGFSKETEALFLKAFDEQKIEVTNREEIEKRIAENTKAEDKTVTGEEHINTEDKTKPATNDEATKSAEPETLSRKQFNLKEVIVGAINSAKTDAEQIEKINMINKIRKGEKISQKEINEVLGKDTPVGKFFSNLSSIREFERDPEYRNDKEMKNWVDKEKKENNIRDEEIGNITVKISSVIDLAKKYTGADIAELEKDENYHLLPKYAKQGIKNLVKLYNAEDGNLKSEDKTRLQGQILGQVIEGRSQLRNITKEVQQLKQRSTTNSKLPSQKDGGR